MPRLPRFFLPGVPLHVVQRGNNRNAIVAGHEDTAFLFGCLEHAASANGVAVHAYVLMTNHVHLLVTPTARTSVPKMMQSAGRVYVKYFNERRGRSGTLFQGRYKATVVEEDRYFLMCMRYIELNPVRAGMAASAGAYRWSSFRANALGARDPLVSPHPLYLGLGRTPDERQASYRELFGTSLDDDELGTIRDATEHAWALGGESFCRRVEAQSRRPQRLPMGRPWPSRVARS